MCVVVTEMQDGPKSHRTVVKKKIIKLKAQGESSQSLEHAWSRPPCVCDRA
jgi:hypothetical protein